MATAGIITAVKFPRNKKIITITRITAITIVL